MSKAWLQPLYTAAQMRAIDAWAIEVKDTPSLELMENAGAAVADAVLGLDPCGRVCAICGKGNNGGDGLVCARLLSEKGCVVEVFLLVPREDFKGDAKVNLERCEEQGGEVRVLTNAGELNVALDSADLVIDAIFGTGFKGESSGLSEEAIGAINRTAVRVVSIDVPSGVDASSGEVTGTAIKADLTVALHADKVGLWINPGKRHAGTVSRARIGIPEPVQLRDEKTESADVEIGLISPEVLDLYPKRDPAGSKFSSGVLAVVGGSTGLTGAVCLAAEAAMRTGAGYVQAVIPASLNEIFEAKLLEVMTVPAPDLGGHLTLEATKLALKASGRADATVLGPGLGRDGDSFALAQALIAKVDHALLIDADGLNAIAGKLDLLARRDGETVLTPHVGELARMLEVDSGEVNNHRLHCVQKVAELAQSVVVLKGDDTIVASPSGDIAVNQRSTAALATAGTGDVLSGITGALLAKGMPAFEAAALAVHLHAEAAIVATAEVGSEGLIASDVIAALPSVLA